MTKKNEPTPEYLTPQAIADILDAAPRHGEPTDTPEGSRVVLLSDTLARLMAQALRCGPSILKHRAAEEGWLRDQLAGLEVEPDEDEEE